MRTLLYYALPALLACAYAQEFNEQQEVQQFQSVKGGGNWQPHGTNSADLVKAFQERNYNNNHFNGSHGYNMRTNLTGPTTHDVGVCYIEVPTATLVRDGKIPSGNGSEPHLSRIRSCCKGYIRNIHNFWKCDPVCTNECVNGLCIAPEVCSCFPDHVQNLAGFCIPTCPIGCQNGQCAGGECLCKDGFKLDADSKFCVPLCQENCGGIGNCTAPNTCDCKPGYQTSPQGSCKPVCDKCSNGDCVAPNDCRCHQGFAKNPQGLCIAHCQPGYQSTPEGCRPVCNQCSNGDCIGPNDCRCRHGYAKDQQGLCVPQCSPACGQGSRCISPNVCDPPISVHQPNNNRPNQPFQPNQYQPVPFYPDQNVVPLSQNVPQCSQACLNGFCVEGNQCNCNPGYVLDKSNPFMCIPNCPGGCANGVCTAPNFCICNAGYLKDFSVKGRPTCVKRSKRSVVPLTEDKPQNIADFLIYAIPDVE